MAQFKPSLLGYTQGGAGNIVVSNWKGKAYLRAKSTKFNTKQTPAQLAHQAKFALVMSTLSQAKPFIDLGYQKLITRQTAINAALAVNIRSAVIGDYPDLSIDFSQLSLSMGLQKGLKSVQATSIEASILELSWLNEAESARRKNDDQIMVWVYSPDEQEVIVETLIENRASETVSLDLPDYFSGKSVHVIVGVVNLQSKDASNSQYVGEVLIA